MTAAEAIAWIMFRDEGFAGNMRNVSPARLDLEVASRTVEIGATAIRRFSSSRRALRFMCTANRVKVTGVPCSPVYTSRRVEVTPEGRREVVASIAWTDLVIGRLGKAFVAQPAPSSQSAIPHFTDLRFLRSDVVREYPATLVPASVSQATMDKQGLNKDAVKRGRPSHRDAILNIARRREADGKAAVSISAEATAIRREFKSPDRVPALYTVKTHLAAFRKDAAPAK